MATCKLSIFNASYFPVLQGVKEFKSAHRASASSPSKKLHPVFTSSGLLITYIALKKLKKNNGQFNLWRYYIHRYWKLTPTFVIISGCIWLIEDLGSGPVWKENIDPLVKSCKKNWWTNVFYISNFLKVQDRCFPHCGFISCLMQFFFISPVIFLVLYRKPVIGKSFILTGILVSAMVLAIITPLLNQMPVLLASVADHSVQMEFLHLVITMPYTHLGTYCVGMATGYLIYTYNEKKLRMHPVLVVFGWIVAITCNMAIVFGLYQWNSNNSLPNKVTATVYAAFSRIGWSLGLAWLTIACLYGYGGIINSFLSWKGFTPLSRMTYVVYIIQPAWIGVFRSHLRSTLYYSNIFVTYIFIAYVTISYIMGFLVVLIYQTPFLNLEKLVLSRTTNEKQDSVEEEKHIGTQTSA
ncbi:nose resistant to fluoxetine protein 6-like [Limulus polyphemus]|uniref:Nose resistant to fluoxetine protein 6-like n=1 Tax=Limulus polyphemus TaxID=6850 RepID=A0ABM1TNL2_LIMPO|nr:nose resistant to fluoxetine protein 6-like [Limulus polyphemus]